MSEKTSEIECKDPSCLHYVDDYVDCPLVKAGQGLDLEKLRKCKHLWAVREIKEKRILSDGDSYPAYTIYFCQYCLEVKKVSDE